MLLMCDDRQRILLGAIYANLSTDLAGLLISLRQGHTAGKRDLQGHLLFRSFDEDARELWQCHRFNGIIAQVDLAQGPSESFQ